MRSALRLLALILAAPLLYLAASLALPLLPGPGPDLSGPPARTIGLLQGPIHTDILFPLTPDIRARFAFAEAAGVPLTHPDAQWLLLGWGSVGPQLLRAFHTVARPAVLASQQDKIESAPKTASDAPRPAVPLTTAQAPIAPRIAPVPAPTAVKVPEPLLTEARSIATSHHTEHGEPITVAQLKTRLGIGLPMATALHAAL